MGKVLSKSSSVLRLPPLPLDLSNFEELCRDNPDPDPDPDVKKFDQDLKVRTRKAISSLARGADATGLTFESLKDVTSILLEGDQKVIMAYKEDVWGNKHLLELVTNFFDSSLAVLNFCHVLDKCIKQARDNQLIIEAGINWVPESGDPTEEQCDRALQELSNFMQAANPFPDEFYEQFETMYRQQAEMQTKLRRKKRKLDKMLKNVKGWEKISTIMLAAVGAAVLIGAVLAAVFASPAIAAAAIATFSALPLESIGCRFKSLWTKYEDELAARRDLVMSADLGAYIAIHDLDNIKALVNQLHNEINSICRNIQFAQEREQPFALVIAVEQIKRKQNRFILELEDLAKHVKKCEQNTLEARGVVLKKLMQPP